MDDGKSTLAQYWAAFIEVIQACTCAGRAPEDGHVTDRFPQRRAIMIRGGGAYRALWI